MTEKGCLGGWSDRKMDRLCGTDTRYDTDTSSQTEDETHHALKPRPNMTSRYYMLNSSPVYNHTMHKIRLVTDNLYRNAYGGRPCQCELTPWF